MASDIQGSFLDDFAIDAIYNDGVLPTTIRIQTFDEPLDKVSGLYKRAFANLVDLPILAKGHSIEFDSVTYAVVDFTIDELKLSVNIFLQAV